ncbi:MAG TPA: phospholipase D family protein [Burkholderiales bacterium]|jgi:phosphatidylserine/phosphatidylglycerophosphate/cardiolipin synthase-like enzyme|nr:phospholipase D family protein [Burkholderiales bacterium]
MRARRLAFAAAVLLGLSLGPAWIQARETYDAIPGSGLIEYAFTPGSDAAGLIIRTLRGARNAVYVQAFSFTHVDIARALIEAHRRGVEVQVIADAGQTEKIEHNVISRLVRAGVPVMLDAEHVSAHNKVMVIDPDGEQPVVITGSFNFTFAAQYRNAENLLVLRGNRELARAYLDNWQRHREHARRYHDGQE